MKKYLLIFMLVVVATFAANISTASAQSPAIYTAEYSVTNFYTDDGFLKYYFAGLDLAENYEWVLQAINTDGSAGEIISTKHSFNNATVTLTWDAGDGDFLQANGRAYQGAARVVDQYGQIQGVHYMLPGCNLILSLECSNAAWVVNGAAVNPATARVIIGDLGNFHPLNADGYFHIYELPTAVLTKQGDYTIMHFRFLAGSPERYDIYNMANPAVLYSIKHADLENYNTDDRNAVLIPYNPTYSFVLLNTSGVRLENINRVEDLTAWANGDNPHNMLVPEGAYDYRHNSVIGALVADGESTWLVGSSPANEWWAITGQEHVSESGQLRLSLVSETSGIWSSGYINHELNDSLMGLIDSDDYGYVKRRNYEYTVFGVQSLGVVSTWSIYPVFHNTGIATFSDRRFDIEVPYDIDLEVSIADRAENSLNELGFDTPLGRSLAMILVMFIVFAVMAKKGARNFVGYAIAFIAIGGVWVAIGLSDTLTSLLFGISAVVLIWLMIGSIRNGGESGAGM